MEKEANVGGWLRGALNLVKNKQVLRTAVKKGKTLKNAISPSVQKSVKQGITTAKGNITKTKKVMKSEAAGFFDADKIPGRMYGKFRKPIVKRPPGRPITPPKQTAGRVGKVDMAPEGALPSASTGIPFSKKYPIKGMAIGGVGGFAAGKFLQSGEEDVPYSAGYPRYANFSAGVTKLLKGVAKVIPDKKAVTIGKYMLGAGGVGVAGGLTTNYLTDDGHDKSDHGRRKTAADMTLKERAAQKYSIAKSYEREGHSRKAQEYKDKASRAYKRAWEIKNK